MLSDGGVNYKMEFDEFIVALFATEKYVDATGDNCIAIVIEEDENGEFIRIFTHPLYQNNQPKHELAILKTCMNLSRLSKMIKFQYEIESADLIMESDIVLEDSQLTKKQLWRVFNAMVAGIDKFDGAFRSAVEDGKDISDQVLNANIRKQKLAALVSHVSDKELDQLIQSLELFDHESSQQSDSIH